MVDSWDATGTIRDKSSKDLKFVHNFNLHVALLKLFVQNVEQEVIGAAKICGLKFEIAFVFICAFTQIWGALT